MSQEPYSAAVPEYGAPSAAKPVDELSEPPRMSPFARLGNIFFSPGEVFEDIRRSPRDWWLPAVLLLAIGLGAGYVIQNRLDFTPERLAAAAVDSGLEQQGKTRKDLSEQERQAVQQQESITATMIRFQPIVALVFVTLFYFVVGAIYYGLLQIVQAKTTFFRVVAVVAYAYFVPNVLKTVLQTAFAFLTSPENVDPGTYLQTGGLLTASPAAFVSLSENPVLFTLLSYFDVFSIWFLILLAIGFSLVTVKRMKTSTALVVAFTPYVIVMLGAVVIKMLTT